MLTCILAFLISWLRAYEVGDRGEQSNRRSELSQTPGA